MGNDHVSRLNTKTGEVVDFIDFCRSEGRFSKHFDKDGNASALLGEARTDRRCACSTGRYPQRLPVGLEQPLKASSPDDVGLPPGHPTVASLLKGNGYETSLVGKWHLGWKPEFGPNRHGFDEFFGILSGAADYFTHRASDGHGGARGPGGAPDLWQNLTPIERVGYLTDLLSDKAVEIIGRSRAKPFFLSLQYHAPHAPWEGPGDERLNHADHGPGPMTMAARCRSTAR
jgi:arylsulfatase A-like enzyme